MRKRKKGAFLAQLAERLPSKQKVASSILAEGILFFGGAECYILSKDESVAYKPTGAITPISNHRCKHRPKEYFGTMHVLSYEPSLFRVRWIIT